VGEAVGRLAPGLAEHALSGPRRDNRGVPGAGCRAGRGAADLARWRGLRRVVGVRASCGEKRAGLERLEWSVALADHRPFAHKYRGYRDWIFQNLDCFVINTYIKPSLAYLSLHRASCCTISFLSSLGHSCYGLAGGSSTAFCRMDSTTIMVRQVAGMASMIARRR
jgi:hypothetical protein